MNRLSWIPLLALTVLSATSWAQGAAESVTVSQGTPMTLWMDWTRGNAHYGPNFIELHRPCEATTSYGCECIAAFKVISSKENSKEFADYVASFEHGKVPVVYSVFFNDQGRVSGARLVRVGDWRSDKFARNDGLLGVSVKFSNKGKIGEVQHAPIHSPSDCFPNRER